MPLPKCVRIPRADYRSANDLLRDGWREIGRLQHWKGKASPADYGAKRRFGLGIDPRKFGFTGRLWRDPEIDAEDAAVETERYLADHDCVYRLNDGFAAVTKKGNALNIDLVGVIKKRQRTAWKIISTAVHHLGVKTVTAATYDDNTAARKLYQELGLKPGSIERVFHKD